jgi:hypothetical protein
VLRKLDMKMRAAGDQAGSPLPRSSAETSHEPQAFFPREKHKPFAEQQADKRKAEFPGQLDGQTCGVTSAAGACTTRPWTAWVPCGASLSTARTMRWTVQELRDRFFNTLLLYRCPPGNRRNY